MPLIAEKGLFLENRFEGRGEGVEVGGELDEDGLAVKDMGGSITSVAGNQGSSESFISGEAGVDEGSEHLLVAEVRFELLIGGRARVIGTAYKIQAVFRGLSSKIRVLEK